MHRVTHFEIPSDNPEPAMKFYSEVFGWKFSQFGDTPYWLANTGPDDKPGIHGGLMKKNHPSQPLTNAIEVDDLDVMLTSISSHGGVVVVDKMPIPGVGWYAYFKDLDGNIMGVMQTDPKAK